MKILIVGLGSMGKRRARLIKLLDNNTSIFGVDFFQERREQATQLGITCYQSIQEAVSANDFTAAFVCTAPLSHSNIISELLDNNLNVFTELNLVDDGYLQNIQKAKDKNLTLFLSNTMLYRGEIQHIKKAVTDFDKPVNYIYHIGQYLPDWHPWENYKNFFVGDKRTNGCREIFGIELPWLLDTFGEAELISSQSRRLTQLEIPYDDTYTVLLKHKNGTIGTLCVDVTSPKAVRSFECFGEALHLFWEGNPKELYQFDNSTSEKVFIDTYKTFEHDNRYSDNIVENAYTEEIMNFFNVLDNKEQPRHTFEKDLECIKLMNDIGV